MRHFNIIALLAFLGALVWVFTWKGPTTLAAKARFMNMFSPFVRGGASVQDRFGGAPEPAKSAAELLAENTELKLEAQRQRVTNEEYDRVQKENNEFRRMLDFARSHPLKLTTARILTRNSSTYWSSATLDRGMSDELAPDLAVRTAEGLVGKLVHLWRRESEDLFITDESCKVAVKIEGSPDQGILSGVRGVSGRTPELRITYLSREAIVPIGAKVYTSGKGTVFPSGILVGEVVRFLPLDDGGEALVRPAVDFDRLKYVFIIDRGESGTAGDETRRGGRFAAMMRFYLMLLGLLGLAFVVQEVVPAVSWAYNARLLVVPVVFFASAVGVPFPVMLVFAFATGFVWDARHLIILPEDGGETFGETGLHPAANPSFGYSSILLYGLLGSLMQGIRPLFRRGRWELPVLMTGLGTALLLTIEHLWICFLRGRFFFSEGIWMNTVTTALLSMMVSPVLFLVVHWLSGVAGYQIRYDGLHLRRSW